jgi:hypothetical protein
MAKHPSYILEMARKGAEHKYDELKAELAALVKHFPHLRGSRASRPFPPVAPAQAVLPAAAPRNDRRKLSAAARRKISVAQKARWAKQKATKG